MKVFWQYHQSSTKECPGNTMGAFEYAWSLGGIPEADIRTTADGVIVAFHDDTAARRTDAPENLRNIPIKNLDYNTVRSFDAGIKTGLKWKGQYPPTITETFNHLKENQKDMMYLDFKDVSLDKLADLIDLYDIRDQLIFTHNNRENCLAMKQKAGIRTMQWMGGSADEIWSSYKEAYKCGFKGLSQIQFHLNSKQKPDDGWPYAVLKEKLIEAFETTRKFNIDFEVLPFEFDKKTLFELLDIGIRWYAIDYPKKFVSWINDYETKQ